MSKNTSADTDIVLKREPTISPPTQNQEKRDDSSGGEANRIIKRLWAFMNQDLGHSFLDADVVDLSRSIAKFLNQDIIGQKIILLDDGSLNETASAPVIFLKRQRYLRKTKARKKAVAQVKNLYQYFNHPFWQKSEMVAKLRVYLKNHLRRITPTIIKNLTEEKQKLEFYFRSDQAWDNTIFQNDLPMKQDAIEFGYKHYTLCQAKKEPLVLNEEGEVFCLFTDCKTHKCQFQANIAHGEEISFLNNLKKLLLNLPQSAISQN